MTAFDSNLPKPVQQTYRKITDPVKMSPITTPNSASKRSQSVQSQPVEQILLIATWKDRRETRGECALRCTNLLNLLKPHPGLSQWFFGESPLPDGHRRPVPVGAEDLEPYLHATSSALDAAPVLQEGFALTICNGLTGDRAASLRISCGGFDSPRANAVMLQLPRPRESSSMDSADYRSLLQAVTDCFDPEKASICSSSRV